MRKTLRCHVPVAAIVLAAGGHVQEQRQDQKPTARGWDDPFVDSANYRLYVSHNSPVEIIDTVDDKRVVTIPNTPGVQGIANRGRFRQGLHQWRNSRKR